MEKTMKEHHLLSLLLIFFFLHLTTRGAADWSSYKPADNVALDCGAQGGNHLGRSWIGDTNSPKYSPIEKMKTSFTSVAKRNPTSLPSIPYSNARLSTSEFTYSFPVTTGPKFIRLYFYPSNYQNFPRADAFFAVKWGNFTLLNNFSAALVADNLTTEGFSREFCVLVENSQRLDLTFTPSTSQPNSYAFINGIEVVSMPDELYFKPVVDTNKSLDGFGYVALKNEYPYSNIYALELIRRLEVGGSSVQAADDTGMYRTWEDDSEYVTSLDKGFLSVNRTIALDYEKIPKYTAPEVVYRTARSMGNNKAINYSYNLTWSFQVDSGFDYLVRLHFCEFQVEIVENWNRVFTIYIDKQVAEDGASVIAWSGGNGNPIYQDYVVFMPVSDKKTSNLDIALHPRPEIITTYSDAILNGIEIFKIGTRYGNSLAGPNPDPVPRPPVPSPPGDKTTNGGMSRKAIVGIAGASAFSLAAVLVLCLIVYKRKEKRRKLSPSECTSWWGPFSHATTKSTTKSHASALPSDLCRHFSLMELKTATNNFDDIFKIGVGGFGKVYKGYIDGGSIPVAIKRLDPGSQQGVHEFMTEIEMLSQLRHLHLVSLIGYCNEQGEMILVYDYMARGTLRDHLYNTANPPLSWKQRLRICIGAARGLHYLHTGAKYTIIHRDMKSTNILLDENWVAKVSDFGLSKVGSMTASKAYISTVVKGTFGYLDPEYYRRQQLTEKSDVYSFGVVLFEVLCARPAVNKNVEKKQVSLAPWAKSCCRNGTIDRITDPHLTGQIAPECLKKFCEIALSCLDDEGMKRPSMNDIVWGLEFTLQLQESAEQDNKDAAEKIQELRYKQDSEEALTKSLAVGQSGEVFSTSDGKSSGMTTSSLSVDEQSSTSYDSDKFFSGAVFSELMNAKGR